MCSIFLPGFPASPARLESIFNGSEWFIFLRKGWCHTPALTFRGIPLCSTFPELGPKTLPPCPTMPAASAPPLPSFCHEALFSFLKQICSSYWPFTLDFPSAWRAVKCFHVRLPPPAWRLPPPSPTTRKRLLSSGPSAPTLLILGFSVSAALTSMWSYMIYLFFKSPLWNNGNFKKEKQYNRYLPIIYNETLIFCLICVSCLSLFEEIK